MQLEMECVHSFHRRLDVSPVTDWEENDEGMKEIGAKLCEMAESLMPRVRRGDTEALRAHLMLEELGEFIQAKNEVTALDGLTDLAYVLVGTAVTYNWPLQEAFAEVHASNMTKKKNAEDKDNARVRDKGSDYRAPDLETVLKTWRGDGSTSPRRASLARALKGIESAMEKHNA